MKKICMVVGLLLGCSYGFSQSITTTTQHADTAKTTTTLKKKLIKVDAKKVNAVQKGPAVTNRSNNSSGTKEEDPTQPK